MFFALSTLLAFSVKREQKVVNWIKLYPKTLSTLAQEEGRLDATSASEVTSLRQEYGIRFSLQGLQRFRRPL